MHILDQDLANLVIKKIITEGEAMLKSSNRERLKKYINQTAMTGAPVFAKSSY